MGPTEERGAALWVGYDLDGVDDDLMHLGLLKADDETAARHGVTTFMKTDLGDTREMTIEEIKTAAAELAMALRAAGPEPISAPLRKRLIAVRAALFQRGVFDPVLVRFDTASAPRASNDEIAAELAKIAESLGG